MEFLLIFEEFKTGSGFQQHGPSTARFHTIYGVAMFRKLCFHMVRGMYGRGTGDGTLQQVLNSGLQQHDLTPCILL